jgi:hypothetical protein
MSDAPTLRSRSGEAFADYRLDRFSRRARTDGVSNNSHETTVEIFRFIVLHFRKLFRHCPLIRTGDVR